MEKKTEKKQMKTLVECMAGLLQEGFGENFTIKETGLFAGDGKRYSPEEVKILNFYRFEGDSDPADSAILYAIETSDGKKGMISDAYGPYSDSKTTKFMMEVEGITKKAHA